MADYTNTIVLSEDMYTLFEKARLALRLTEHDYDSEIVSLINAGLSDLGLVGISTVELADPLIERAVISYCRVNFGSPDDYDRMKKAYDEQKAQLMMASGYREA